MESENIAEEVETQDLQKTAETKSKDKQNTRRRFLLDISYIGLFAALLAICSWLYIVIPATEVVVTMQTLGVCVVAGLLGWKRGTICICVYILLGICGIPVFAGFKNFYALLAGPSAGYVLGFIFTTLIVGFTADKLPLIGKRTKSKVKSQVLQLIILAFAMIVGVAVCYVFGTLWYMLVFKGSATAENLQIALTYCVYPFILPDFIKIIVATVLVNRLKKHIQI